MLIRIFSKKRLVMNQTQNVDLDIAGLSLGANHSLAQSVRIDEVPCLPHRIDVQGGRGGLDAGTVPHFWSLDLGQYGRLKVMTVVGIQHSEHIMNDRYR